MRGDQEHSTTKVASEPAALIPFPPGLPISQCADGYMHGTSRAMGLTGIRSLTGGVAVSYMNGTGVGGHRLHTLRIVRLTLRDREPIRFSTVSPGISQNRVGMRTLHHRRRTRTPARTQPHTRRTRPRPPPRPPCALACTRLPHRSCAHPLNGPRTVTLTSRCADSGPSRCAALSTHPVRPTTHGSRSPMHVSVGALRDREAWGNLNELSTVPKPLRWWSVPSVTHSAGARGLPSKSLLVLDLTMLNRTIRSV